MHSSIPVSKIISAIVLMLIPFCVYAQDDESSDTLSLTFDRLFEEMTGQESDIDFDSDAYVYVNSQTPDAPFRRARRGIIVVGDRDTVRAMEPFSGPEANLVRYASTVNAYSRALGDSVTVYCMPNRSIFALTIIGLRLEPIMQPGSSLFRQWSLFESLIGLTLMKFPVLSARCTDFPLTVG